MFVGHMAMALGAKKAAPTLPLGVAVGAAFGLDLLWPVLLLAGLEAVRVNPGDTAFTNLAFDSYPWSHSLAMVLLWSGLAGGLAARLLGSTKLGVVVAVLVLSHWLLDLITHRPDLPLWPGGPVYGMGLWNSIPGTLATEGLLFGAGVAAYLAASVPRDRVGSVGLAAMLGLCLLMWASQPWAPPPPSSAAVAWGALILWLLVPWSRWVDRHRLAKGPA